jgi:hypothetical protein
MLGRPPGRYRLDVGERRLDGLEARRGRAGSDLEPLPPRARGLVARAQLDEQRLLRRVEARDGRLELGARALELEDREARGEAQVGALR